jgi:RimJ/RimL family protein N-acetyltransferase
MNGSMELPLQKNLETKRLILRGFTLNDATFIISLLNTPGWLQFIGDRNVKTQEQARAYLLNGPLKSYHENGFGLCMVELKSDGTPIGMCGLLKRDYLESPDIGFALMPEYSRMGYAFEAANAIVSYAKEILKLNGLMAITMQSNKSSIGLLEKVGFSFTRMIALPSGGEELMLFALGFK